MEPIPELFLEAYSGVGLIFMSLLLKTMVKNSFVLEGKVGFKSMKSGLARLLSWSGTCHISM